MNFFIGALLAFIILRLPSLFEPHWYGDEGIYAAITFGLESGKQLYVDIWDNKPMLIYWLYGLAEPSNRLVFIRLLNMAAGIVSLIGLHLILKNLKIQKIPHALALGIFVYLMGTPVLEGNITNAENLFIPLTIFGYLTILQKKPSYALAGLLFGIAFLLKFHPIFDFAAVVAYMLITRKKLKYIFVLIGFFALPNFLQYAYWFVNGNLLPAFHTIFFNNFGYTSSYSSGIRSVPLKTVALGISCLLLAKKYTDDALSSKKLFIILIIIFEAFGVLFGGRQYTHYMIQLVPGVVIASGLLIQKLQKGDGIIQLKYIAACALVVFLFLKIFYQGEGEAVRQSLPKYYGAFYDFAVGKKPYFLYGTDESLANLERTLDRYQSKHTFVYTNNAWVYDVLEIVPPTKIVAGYHRTFIPEGEFMESLRDAKVDIVVMDISADPDEELNEYIVQEYRFAEQVENYDIWVRVR